MRIVPATEENISSAAELLRAGEIIGMPTETVYGVAAIATDEAAVRKIFDAKKRPADNPLIVHIASLDQILEVAAVLTESAQELAQRFWPGPLTVVLPKSHRIPAVVSGGLDTVAVRVPSHPVALSLIRKSGPISAPSANTFMRLSPTRAEDIEPELAEHLALILDGGPCVVGVESTVVDCTGPTPRLLRPGGLDRASIEAALGKPLGDPSGDKRMAPGSYPRHYSPKTPLKLVERLAENQSGITFEEPINPSQLQLPRDPRAYAAALYAALHRLDSVNLETIYVEQPPKEPAWEAVWDRLERARERRL
jgi:L-threonylcarbamoyladenylate synthase